MGWLGVKPFDLFPFSLLTLAVSLEAIFMLSTFVLINQNLAGKTAVKRANLDRQIDRLAEQEITSLLRLMAAVADPVGLDVEKRSDHHELMTEVGAREVPDEIEPHKSFDKTANKPLSRSRRSPTD